jgi:hypothetical protein
MAGAQAEDKRCDDRVAALFAGTVFVADGERSPRAKELLANECGPTTAVEVRSCDDVAHPPLRKTNPALCERLAKATPPEGFALRQEGGGVTFYYFAFDEVDGRLRMRDVYSKVAMDPGSLFWGSPPKHGPCWFRSIARDVGSAPIYAAGQPKGWYSLTLDSEDPDTARIGLCYGRHAFRRASQKLEVSDGG